MEKKIIDAAGRIFLKKGFKDTNMSDIAAEVGLTRPALHYYFRTKERLFQAVFGDILLTFLPRLSDIISSDNSLKRKLEMVTDEYIGVLGENPDLPLFLMKEAFRDFEGFVKVAVGSSITELGTGVFEAISREMKEGRMRTVPMIEIFYTFYGLVSIPFVSMPVATYIFGQETIDGMVSDRWRKHIVSHMMLLLDPSGDSMNS